MTQYEISDDFAEFRAIFRGFHENCPHFSPEIYISVLHITQTSRPFSAYPPPNALSPAHFSV